MYDFEIGIDIEKIHRFDHKEYLKNNIFLKKIFTQKELDYCFSKNNPPTHLAGRYAAKEAIVKALSPISNEILTYDQIEILNNLNGIPKVSISNDKLNKLKIKVSISHNNDDAIAMAIVYQ